jgi:ATP-binding cassette subfamily C (CFTR/MRP) protein 1
VPFLATGALVIQGNVNPGLAGLALVYALDLTRFLKVGTNMAAKAEADFNSVERIIQVSRCMLLNMSFA